MLFIEPARIEPDAKQEEAELIRGNVNEEVATVDIDDATPEECTAQQSAVKKEEMEATGRTEPGQIESGHFSSSPNFQLTTRAQRFP